jgi:hypothetical protein
VDKWVKAALPCRNARIRKAPFGRTEFIEAEFDTEALVNFVAPLVLPAILAGVQSELLESDEFKGKVALETVHGLMEHMTPEELAEVFGRFEGGTGS